MKYFFSLFAFLNLTFFITLFNLLLDYYKNFNKYKAKNGIKYLINSNSFYYKFVNNIL